jgi:hypothetical protein
LGADFSQVGLVVPDSVDWPVDVGKKPAYGGIEVEVSGPPVRDAELGNDLFSRFLESAVEPVVSATTS